MRESFILKPVARKPVALWLMIAAVAVFSMILLGGATRLTGSGLSIVEWRPVTGIMPPLTAESWDHEFSKYKTHSEFQKVNSHMDVSAFKSIYMLEYIHRLWGRLLGLFLFVPFIIFWAKKWLSPALMRHVCLTFVLGGAQGLMGWVMVKSGLGDDPQVSPIKLMLHLILAVWILWRLVWASLCVFIGQRWSLAKQSPFRALLPLGGIVFIYGALVAGHKAGLIYNTFPLMGGDIFPAELATMGWLDGVCNPVTVQFIHRWLAIILVAAIAIALAKRPENPVDRKWLKGLLHLSLLQATLGITTLLLHVHMHVALMHQAMGVLLIMGLLMGAHRIQFSGSNR